MVRGNALLIKRWPPVVPFMDFSTIAFWYLATPSSTWWFSHLICFSSISTLIVFVFMVELLLVSLRFKKHAAQQITGRNV
jgi:hypothetical protein